jgi:hypothetical protein
MTPEMLGLIKMVVALARMMGVDPLDLAREYLREEENDRFYAVFCLIAADD